MATAKDALYQIQSHEKECAIRYQNIEKRLDEGSDKFKRLENLLWGVYPFIVGAIVLTIYLCLLAYYLKAYPGLNIYRGLLILAIILQFIIGVANLLFYLPIALATMHNLGAALLVIILVIINSRITQNYDQGNI